MDGGQVGCDQDKFCTGDDKEEFDTLTSMLATWKYRGAHVTVCDFSASATAMIPHFS